MVMQERTGLPKSADRLGRKLVRMVLPSGRELRSAAGLSRNQFKDGIKYLIKEKLVAWAEFGGLVRGVRRYWLSKEGLDYFEASEEEKTWHGPDAIGVLVDYDMPKVEAVHAVADRYATDGRTISAIHFVEREPMCAVVELTFPGESYPAYLVVCRASIMDTESELFYRLQAIPEAMRKRSLHPADHFFPAALAIVGASEWSAARALTMASVALAEWVPPSHITAWYHKDDELHGSDGRSVKIGSPPESIPRLLPPTPLLQPVASVRKLGNKDFDRLIAQVLWSGLAGQKLVELLTLVGEYAVGAVGHYRGLIGEAPDEKKTEKRMATLQQLGLVEVATKRARAKRSKRFWKGVPVTLSGIGQGADRYVLTKTGRNVFCHFHGGRPADLLKRTKQGRLRTKLRNGRVEDRWPYRHEGIACELLAAFGEKGCPFAPGWQARTALADGKGIDPDGKVLLRTPWGRRWCHLEIELSDTSYSALKPRCGKYGSSHRRDDDPALFVCPDERAERNLHRAAAEFSPKPLILTTTLRRLKVGGVFGTGVWVEYGTPVTLAAPGSET